MPDALPDDLILAAIERAERHRTPDRPGVPFWHVVEHLGLRRGAGTTRRVRPEVERLGAEGLAEQTRLKGLVHWALTARGRRRLGRLRRAGRLPELPESPQHWHWRAGRDTAAEQIASLRADLRQKLDAAAASLDRDQDCTSDEIIAVGDQLREACWRLGAATYCLHEWAEPDDVSADLPELAERGKRNTLLWADDPLP
jgi:hypothetical protein